MTTYTFTGAVAYDRLGSSWRTAAGLRSVSVTDPATGLLPANLHQAGVAVSWLTADTNSRYSFTCDVPGVVVDFGAGAQALYATEVPGLAIAAGAVNGAQVDARMKWAPSTAYTLGQQIINPTADVVKANVAHTSAGAYATDVAKWDLSATQTTANNAVAKAVARVRSAVLTNGTDQTATLNAEMASLSTFGGGAIELPGSASAIKCNGTLFLADGVTLAGTGMSPASGGSTRFDFTGLPVGTNAFRIISLSDVVLRDFYVSGWASGGTASVITTSGNNRRVTIERVTVNAVTTGVAFDIGPTGYVIESSLRGCTAVGATYGFNIGPACTSVNVDNCYANACTEAGYLASGTYLAFSACAADTSTHFGYLIQGKAIALIGCGAEGSGRTAFYLTGADGVTIIGARGVNNNSSAGAYMSLVAINDASDNVTVIGCVDTTPNAASTNSVGNSSGTPGLNVTVMNNDLAKGVQATQASLSVTAATGTGAPAAGGAGALPATPLGYATVSINGVARKVAYY